MSRVSRHWTEVYICPSTWNSKPIGELKLNRYESSRFVALKIPSIFNCLKKPIYLQCTLLILNKADPVGTGVMLSVIETLKYRLANSCFS